MFTQKKARPFERPPKEAAKIRGSLRFLNLKPLPPRQPVPLGNQWSCWEVFKEAGIKQRFTSNITQTRPLFLLRLCSSVTEFNDIGSDRDFGNLEND